MTRFDLSRTIIALAGAAVLSAACLTGALAPARLGADQPVASARLAA